MIILKKKSYILMLVVLIAAVVFAAWKNVRHERPETDSAVFSENTVPRDIGSTQPSGDRGEASQELLVGVWIPYMSLQTDGTEKAFEMNFDEKLRMAVSSGANAVFVHVRPFADSVYPSSIEPWSHILTGTQGKDPGFDPLEYMVQKTHEAGLAFHAWINPLRISTGVTPAVLSENSFYVQNRDKNPHFFMEYEGGLYYNPAVSDVRERIADGTVEIVKNYDVDGIHFDDYFYPAAVEALDSSTYTAYTERAAVPLSLEDWREANINALISAVYQKIKRANPNVIFGISPQGNLENNKRIGADVYTWCAQNGYIDYICPQLYYSFENSALPFERALQTWMEMPRAEGVELYIGLAVYKAGTDADDGTWLNSDRNIAKQIELSAEGGADGIVLYAVDHLDDDVVLEEVKNAEDMIQRLVS